MARTPGTTGATRAEPSTKPLSEQVPAVLDVVPLDHKVAETHHGGGIARLYHRARGHRLFRIGDDRRQGRIVVVAAAHHPATAVPRNRERGAFAHRLGRPLGDPATAGLVCQLAKVGG